MLDYYRVFASRLGIAALIVCVFAITYYCLPSSSSTPHFHYTYHDPSRPQKLTLLDSFYFSLVTQSTVGYGSIVPVSTVAKCIVAAQVMSTLFFVIYLSTRMHL